MTETCLPFAEDSRETRISLSRATRKYAEHLASLTPTFDHKHAMAAKKLA
jgi:hypothetical protein